MKSSIALLLTAVAAENTNWPRYDTSNLIDTPTQISAMNGGYACLRAGFTWIPQVSVTGSPVTKTAGTPSGARWFRTDTFRADVGGLENSQACCPLMELTLTGNLVQGTYADLKTSLFDTCPLLFTDNEVDEIRVVEDVPYINFTGAGNNVFAMANSGAYNTDFVLAATW